MVDSGLDGHQEGKDSCRVVASPGQEVGLVIRELEHLDGHVLVLSVLIVVEVLYGVHRGGLAVIRDRVQVDVVVIMVVFHHDANALAGVQDAAIVDFILSSSIFKCFVTHHKEAGLVLLPILDVLDKADGPSAPLSVTHEQLGVLVEIKDIEL